jgi:hypothetical protein
MVIAGRAAYDPATTVGSTDAVPDTIPSPYGFCRGYVAALSPPTSAGTANNYRRTENEVDDQTSGTRLDHKFS